MHDKRSALRAHVDEWEQGQNSSINIESTVAIEAVRLLVLLFDEVFSFLPGSFSLHDVAHDAGELSLRMSFCDPYGYDLGVCAHITGGVYPLGV